MVGMSIIHFLKKLLDVIHTILKNFMLYRKQVLSKVIGEHVRKFFSESIFYIINLIYMIPTK